MSYKNLKIFTVISSLAPFIIGVNNANAAGFAADLYSASSLGNSHAGAVSGSHDISNLFSNPANSAQVADGSLVISTTYLDVNIDDDNASSVRGSDFGSPAVTGSSRNDDGGIDNAILPSFYYANRINDEVVFGFNITTPFALATKYDDNWVGRYTAIESDIKTVNANPSLSYKISDQISIGAGLQFQYMKAILTKDAFDGSNSHRAKIKGDDFGYGYNFGAKYLIADNLKIGLGYRSKIDHKLEGKGQIATMGEISDINTNLTTPESFNIGFSYDINNRSELLSDFSWTRWSRVGLVDINAPSSTTIANDDLDLNMQDSKKIALGYNYVLNEKFKIRTGTAYEESAIKNAEYRTARIPTGDVIWATAGFEYKIANDMKIDFAYLHQFYKKASSSLDASSTGATLEADYKVSVDAISVAFAWDF